MKSLYALALLFPLTLQAAEPTAADVSGRAVLQNKDGKLISCTLGLTARVLRGDTYLWLAGSLTANEGSQWAVKGAYFETPKHNFGSAAPEVQPIRSFSIQAEGQPVLPRLGYANIKTEDATILYNAAPAPSAALIRAVLKHAPVQLSVLDGEGTTEVFRGVAHISENDRNKMI